MKVKSVIPTPYVIPAKLVPAKLVPAKAGSGEQVAGIYGVNSSRNLRPLIFLDSHWSLPLRKQGWE
ncbi:MAG: hypothetical protein COS84_10460 [Armatimonadetes bacterium CG07_land_8_20_14_0_80_40_9]|nr:MAG: hypothetical protein COS84_10460 [Armatimonadetes bacterium CG07_land_8_20_14_0_80_40_9]